MRRPLLLLALLLFLVGGFVLPAVDVGGILRFACTELTSHIANQPWCLPESAGGLFKPDGSGWAAIAPATGPSGPYFDSRNYANLRAALSAIGSSKAALLVRTPLPVTGTVKIPSNVTLWFLPPGYLSIPTGTTVTLNGPVVSGLSRIFSLAGTATVLFCTPGTPPICAPVDAVYPQWFGAVGDNSTDDSAAFLAAVNSVSTGSPQLSGIPVRVPRAFYYVRSTITITGATQILGAVGQDGPRIITDQAISIFNINTKGNDWTVEIGGLTLVGGTNGIEVLNSSGFLSHFSSFSNLTLANQSFSGIKVTSGAGCGGCLIGTRHQNLNLSSTGQYGVYVFGGDPLGSTHWDNFRVTGTSRAGFQVLNTDRGQWEPNILFTNPIFEGNQGNALYLSNVQTTVINGHFELNGQSADLADIHMDGNTTITCRLNLIGGVFSAAGAGQKSGTRVFFANNGMRLRVFGMNGAGSIKIDGNDKITSSSITLFDAPDFTVVNYRGGVYSHYP